MQNPASKGFRLAHQESFRKPRGLERVNRECDVGIFVIYCRWQHPLRKIVRFIADLFSSLVEFLLNVGGWHVVLQRDRHERKTGPREGIDVVVPTQFLNPLFERFGGGIMHFLRRWTWP